MSSLSFEATGLLLPFFFTGELLAWGFAFAFGLAFDLASVFLIGAFFFGADFSDFLGAVFLDFLGAYS